MEPKTVGRISGQRSATRQHESLSGIMPGTQILTQDGLIPIEMLAPGDKVISRNTGMVPLRDIEYDFLICEAVLIKAGSLGHDRPDTDTILPAHQKVLIRDWRAKALYGEDQALIEARRLVDGEYVRLQPRSQFMLFKLHFDEAEIIYADGLEIECAPVNAPLR